MENPGKHKVQSNPEVAVEVFLFVKGNPGTGRMDLLCNTKLVHRTEGQLQDVIESKHYHHSAGCDQTQGNNGGSKG